MPKSIDKFNAYRIHSGKDAHRAGLESINLDDLQPGEVIIEAHYSSVNYKDVLAGTGKGRILRKSPLVGGIDVSGIVVSSEDSRFGEGDEVLVTGCGLSEVHDGGYAEFVRVPADWIVPLPDGLTLKESMIIGTAGFTAALALQRMEENHQKPGMGPILVTGASGGVGSFAIDIFSGAGYEVAALTGTKEAASYLESLGAAEVIDRNELDMDQAPLQKALWGGAVDNVGDVALSWLAATVKPWGNIASIGLAAGPKLNMTVMPFILRGVSILGITSSNCPMEWRKNIWQRLANDLRPRHLNTIHSETIALDELADTFSRVLAGQVSGRILVDIQQRIK